MSLSRIPEPKLLSPAEDAAQYHAMDHDQVNRQFVDDLIAGGNVGPKVIDLGCGPAGIAIELCRRDASIEVMAVDAEIEMLEIAKVEIDIAGMLYQITLLQADVCEMDVFDDGMADAVISNSLLHHLDDPAVGLRTAVRLVGSDGRLFIRDLARPDSAEAVEALVSQYAGDENATAQQLLRQSLHAALTLEEIREIVAGFNSEGLGISPEHVQMTSDRHWTLDWCRSS